MLSVCIPVYNYDVRPLAEALHRQAKSTGVPFEILVYDDGSPDEDIKKQNQDTGRLPSVRYRELEGNIGRSAIRNMLGREARFAYLLFMDCDSQVPNDTYIQAYLEAAGQADVVCGGRTYTEQPPEDPARYLRWLYGSRREVRTAGQRMKEPGRAFMSNNFLIRKMRFMEIGFNEELQGYGHEDTLFGYMLAQKGHSILHIDNPLVHIGLESADDFLEKTRQGLENLHYLYHKHRKDKNFIRQVRLLKKYHLIKRLGLRKAFLLSYYLLYMKRVNNNLRGPKPSLFYFDLYKLASLLFVG